MKKYIATADQVLGIFFQLKMMGPYAESSAESVCESRLVKIPPNGKWLTREEVEAFVSRIVHQYDYNAVYGGCELELDELFGETP